MYEAEQKIYRERQMMRYQLLKDIYEIYFETNGKGKQVVPESLKPEDILAYKYLQDLGMIACKPIINMNESVNDYTITARGINLIEDGRGRRRGDFRDSGDRP